MTNPTNMPSGTASEPPRRRVAFLGPPGTFSEQAAVLYAPDAELIDYPTISTAAEAPVRGDADCAIVPFENSIAGAVGETHDLIIHHLNLRIRDELVLPIEHCLILPPESSDGRCRADHLPPAAVGAVPPLPAAPLPRCAHRSDALDRRGGRAGRSRTAAARLAAIGPRRAAEIHNAQIVETGIEDDHRNATRFIVLAADDREPTGNDKTTLVFSTANRPGALLRALEHFAARSINLTRIESRPARERLGAYLFIVDCDGHREDAALAGALLDLQQDLDRLRVVGSYPRAEPPAA